MIREPQGLITITQKRLDQPITEQRLERALARVATIISSGQEQYLPIFLRLEKELASCKKDLDAIERAKIFCGKGSRKN